MRIHFLGVGEACDELYPNTSIVIQSKGGGNFLLDCGFSTPHLYFAMSRDPNSLDCVWISHFHGDHFFGIPLLLLRFWEMGRSRPLVVAGPQGVEEKVAAAMELAYPGFMSRLQYDLKYIAVEPGLDCRISGTCWTTAETVHSQRTLALRIVDGPCAVFYSGDGRPTSEVEQLATGCDLVIQEAFWLDKETESHGNIVSSIRFAQKTGAKHLALVHLERNCRRNERKIIMDLIASSPFHVFLPEPGDMISL
ncbi:MAG: MBL fold metallo-hydrolase [Pseudomonadota bacterium]